MKRLLAGLPLVLAVCAMRPAAAEDIEIFRTAASDAVRPNVVMLLDNTANWNTVYAAEKSALQAVVAQLAASRSVRLGLFLFTETGNPNDNVDGAYPRYRVRTMNEYTGPVLSGLVGGLDRIADKSNGGKLGKSMAEVYRYFKGTISVSGWGKVKSDPEAFVGGNPSSKQYVSPLRNVCAKNYVIYISNGPAQDNTADTTDATAQLASFGGSTTMIPLSPSGSQTNVGDEWARFMRQTDLDGSTETGLQNIDTYVIDVLPKTTGQGPGWTALLKSMAGRPDHYYVSDGTVASLVGILTDIFDKLLAVDSVFAAASLPVSANAQGAYLNQVYVGMFRPDPDKGPRWAGNLKLYQMAMDSTTGVAYMADARGQAVESTTTGFILSNAESFWTHASTFWSFAPSGTPPSSSDLPDGEVVEKGGAAQMMREGLATPTDRANRKVYIATAAGALAQQFDTTTVTPAALGLAATDTAERDLIVRWVRGEDNMDDNGNGSTADARAYVHGDVLHSRPAIVNYNRYGGEDDVVIYYGDNGGMLRAVQGGKASGRGVELWSFVAPEFMTRLKRLRDNSPDISFTIGDPNQKPYFFDGPFGAWTRDANNDGRIVAAAGDRAIVVATARRGGRLVYAFDVTDPEAPVLLWKKGPSDIVDLGETWAQPKFAMVRGQTDPVVVFGLGYDAAAEDTLPAGTPSMGRGVVVLNLLTGAVIRRFGTGDGMDKPVPGDVVLVDRNGDGIADRMYVGDTGARLWRIELADNDPARWTAYKIADLGGSGADARKFLYKPDVVLTDDKLPFDAVLIGSGDREKPFDTTVRNRFYMIKDFTKGTMTGAGPAAIRESDLTDMTGATAYDPLAAGNSGWYIRLASGEKLTGHSVTLGGKTVFATNTPAPEDSLSCSSLGIARIYQVDYLTAAGLTGNGGSTMTSRYDVRAGGGLPTPPVPMVIPLPNGKAIEGVIVAPTFVKSGGTPLERRYRQYWYRDKDRRG